MDRFDILEAQTQFESNLRTFLKEQSDKLGVNFEMNTRDRDNNIVISSGDREKIDFDHFASKLGYKKEWFGKTFLSNGTAFKIVGCNRNSTFGYNVLRIERVGDRRTFVCKARMVENSKFI